MYYVGVVAGSGDEPQMLLTATVDTPRGALLVRACTASSLVLLLVHIEVGAC